MADSWEERQLLTTKIVSDVEFCNAFERKASPAAFISLLLRSLLTSSKSVSCDWQSWMLAN
jgi:hypothetical protein